MDARFLVELQIIIGSFFTSLFQNIQEQTKALVFVFVFVFVLVDEQAISTYKQAVTCYYLLVD